MSSKEELYKVLVESVPYGTLFFAYGVCIDANKSALQLLNCNLDQIVGASLDNITGEESSALIDLKLYLKKATKNRDQEFQWQCPIKEGYCHVVVNIVYVSEKGKELVVMLNYQQAGSQTHGQDQGQSLNDKGRHQVSEKKPAFEAAPYIPTGKNSSSKSQLSPVIPINTPEDSVPSFTETPFMRVLDSSTDGLSGLKGEAGKSTLGSGENRFRPEPVNSESAKLIVSNTDPELKDFNLLSNLVEASGLANSVDLEREKLEERLNNQDDHLDKLTRLPNRQMLSETITQFLDSNKNEAVCGALMLLDLDHFKDINDSWGHAVGDQVIKKIGKAVASLITGDNMLARMNGDEFALFIPKLSDGVSQAAWNAQAVAETVGEIVATPIFQDGHEIILTASIGISLISDTGVTTEHILQYADTAMYEAKRKGQNSIAFFDPCITEKAQRQIGMNTRLRKALDNHEFALFVQPQICVQSGEMLGGEVLLRWMSSDKVTNMPSEFIPVLESSGLIVDVGRWVIRTACEYVRTFLDRGIWQDHMRLSINISPRQFRDPQLLEIVQHSMSSYNIDPKFLNFEVTENLVIDDVEQAIQTMEAIKSLGAMFSIDDFGIGYSSMIYLKRLPFDHLKIDREFIRNIHRDPENRGVVEAIMAVSKQYGLKVTAEGVEDREALAILRELGCHSYQGAHFSMPVPCDHFTKLLAA